ncbi:glycosyltransferase family 2 protein [Methylomonas koyamae]|uniref:Rhamnosyltransferase n=1 Tax=Methylomonas koyamae TaxID=702114 RepID=A0AA91I769_9GAMM|nr:glycosyltransferase [Methylomonas koyamae]OAI29900.1 rhamnosyltransferase [Methylomonas koyamae]
MSKVGLIVPTLNAGALWPAWLQALAGQTRKPDYLLLIDSSSADATAELARGAGFEVKTIARQDFNHGGTRQFGVDYLADAEILLFLTQDALLADAEALANLLAAFADPEVGAAYGRQLPHIGAGAIGAHARLFNYPAQSQVRSLADRTRFGIKTVFISNSFAGYRRSALLQAGGFPRHTVMNEDTFAAGKMLLHGWKLQYCADARVFHSHDYGFADEFRRYFDIGVFHNRAPWLQQTFGGAAGEGKRFVVSEMRYLFRHAQTMLPSAMLRTLLKWLGYHIGRSCHRRLPARVNRYFSLHRAYWSTSFSSSAPPGAD